TTERFRVVRPRVIGDYEVVAGVGKGSSGEALLAVHRSPDFRKVAVLKALRSELEGDPGAIDAFLREARLSANLRHPNIVQTYGILQADDRYYLAMEYLEGVPLDRVLRRLDRRSERMPEALAIHIVREALEGLSYAHELIDFNGRPLRIVHRDVSPANLFVCWDGTVKVLDFGVASTTTTQTDSGLLRGRLAYMAPEQAMGTVDPRADLFALGVVLYELLTGSLLRPAGNDIKTLETMQPTKDALETALEGQSRAARAAVLGALAPIDARFSNAAKMAAALDQVEEAHQRETLATFIAERFIGERQAQEARLADALKTNEPSSSFPPEEDVAPPETPRLFLGLVLVAALVLAWILLQG
ncbi:MAG: serine/threonine-protein kinase, partial [Myxococcota bacterium]